MHYPFVCAWFCEAPADDHHSGKLVLNYYWLGFSCRLVGDVVGDGAECFCSMAVWRFATTGLEPCTAHASSLAFHTVACDI